MYARIASTALAACTLMLLAATLARADVLVEFPIDMMFGDISLSGSGAMPLGENRDDVESQVTVEQSAVAASTMSGVVSFSDLFEVTVDLTGTFYLDLSFTDIDGSSNYGAPLGGTVSLPASAAKPLIIGLNFTVTQAQLEGIAGFQFLNPDWTIQQAVDAYNASVEPDDQIEIAISDPGVELALGAGVDLNGNGFDDALTYMGSGLMFSLPGDVQLLTTSLVSGTTITASSVIFNGGVADLVADPSFEIMLDGTVTLIAPVSAPASALLLALGLAGAAAAHRGMRRG